jgi:PAT family beta-lactamase induction signal transducer AmpG
MSSVSPSPSSSPGPPAVGAEPSLWSNVALLSTLYFSQGLPFGFFTQALPVWMRQAGVDLAVIGLSSLLALPWGLKFLWAPVVDRFGGSALGRRRGWILPLQAASIVAIGVLALIGDRALASMATKEQLVVALAVGMFVTNLIAATQDIATDGFAIDLLPPAERGLGNGVQVAAYRVGMVVGGGALLVVLGRLGWLAAFSTMSVLLVLASIPIFRHVERPPAAAATGTTTGSTTLDTMTEPVTLAAALQFLRRGGGTMLVWCCALGFYKFGDGFGSAMVRPFLVDRGVTTEQIGTLVGTAGSVAGMVGALLGGWFARHGRLRALLVAGLVHAALMAGYALAVGNSLAGAEGGALGIDLGAEGGIGLVAVLLVAEHVTGGMATVALFTAMMDACDRRTGATDYTVQASVVVFASGIGSSLSGFVARAAGYGGHFVLAGVLCVVGTMVMLPLYRRGIAPTDPTRAAS